METGTDVKTDVETLEPTSWRRVLRVDVRLAGSYMHMLRAILVIALASSVCTYTHTGSDTGSER